MAILEDVTADALPEGPQPDPVADLLEAAADVLIDLGWTQKQSRDPATGGVCLVGALAESYPSVMGGDYPAAICLDIWNEAINELDRHCRHRIGCVTWNDTPGRTKQEVLGLLYETIEDRRAGR